DLAGGEQAVPEPAGCARLVRIEAERDAVRERCHERPPGGWIAGLGCKQSSAGEGSLCGETGRPWVAGLPAGGCNARHRQVLLVISHGSTRTKHGSALPPRHSPAYLRMVSGRTCFSRGWLRADRANRPR